MINVKDEKQIESKAHNLEDFAITQKISAKAQNSVFLLIF